MVDLYHLFKLGTTAARILKASKGTYDIAVITKGVWKPLATMGVVGFADAACEEIVEKTIEKITKETK